MRRRWPRVCAALVIAASLTGVFVGAAAAAPQKLTICMGPGAFFYIIHYIAEGGGFFKEEGLTTETIDVPSGPAQVAAIMGGSVDVGPLGLQLVVQATAQGGDMVAISAGYNAYPITLVLSNDAIKKSGIARAMTIDEKVKRLHGLRLGVTTPGSGTDDMARIIFKTRGMDPDREVTIQPLGTTDSMLAALQQGATDGFFYTSPIPELAVTRGLGQIMIEPLTGEVPEVKGVPYIILATSHATLEKKRPLMLAAVRAYTRAMQFVREKPDEARRITRPFFKAMDEAVFNAAFDKYATGLPAEPVITPDQLAKTVSFMNLVKKSPVSANYDDVVYPDLGREAAKQILAARPADRSGNVMTTAARPSNPGSGLGIVIWQIVVGVLLLGVWEAAGYLSESPWISRPSLIAATIVHWLFGDLYIHVATTAAEMGTGLVLGTVFGIAAGLVLGRSPTLAIILRPIIFALYSVPLISLAPLLIMFFGLDMMPKIVLVTVVVFFLIFFNTFAGVEAVDRDLITSLQLMGSNRREQFQKVIAPACMAWIIGGIKIALPYALVATTTGEMLSARRGLGFLLSEAASQFNTTALYAVLFILMLMGLIVSEAATRLEQWMLRWRHAAE